MIEAPAGDPLVPAAWVALCVGNGQIDFARRIADAIDPFQRECLGCDRRASRFSLACAIFDEELEVRIQKGIAQNDRGKLRRGDQGLRRCLGR